MVGSGVEPDRAADRLLGSGEYYSPMVAQERHGPLLLTELAQPRARALPRHEHAQPYVTIVLAGQYSEHCVRHPTALPPFTAIFNPSGVSHTAEVGPAGTRLFTVECPLEFLVALDLRLPSHPVVDAGTSALLWSGLELFSAFKARTADPLVAEGQTLEMLGALSGPGTTVETAPPPWFRRLRDRLHAQFRESLRLSDLAAEAGVHPVHVARVFRAREGQTPGAYVQRLRVRAACERLRDDELSLAHVAADSGFADQSHFNRTFKKIVGVTPGAFRKALLVCSRGR